MEAFINKFKDRQLKKSNKKIKKLEDKLKELKLQLTIQSVLNCQKNITCLIKMVGQIYYQESEGEPSKAYV